MDLTGIWHKLPDPEILVPVGDHSHQSHNTSPTNLFIQFIEPDKCKGGKTPAPAPQQHRSATYFCFQVTNLHRYWQYVAMDRDEIQVDRNRYCPQLTMSSDNLISYIKQCLCSSGFGATVGSGSGSGVSGGASHHHHAKIRTKITNIESTEHVESDTSASARCVLHIEIDSNLTGHGSQTMFQLPFHWEFKCLPIGAPTDLSSAVDRSVVQDQLHNCKKRKRGDSSAMDVDDASIVAERAHKRPVIPSSHIDTAHNNSGSIMSQREMTLARHSVIQPLYSLVRVLFDQVNLLKKQCSQRDMALQKIREMYPGLSQKFDLDSMTDVNHLENRMLQSCHYCPDSALDLSFSGAQNQPLLLNMFSRVMSDMNEEQLSRILDDDTTVNTQVRTSERATQQQQKNCQQEATDKPATNGTVARDGPTVGTTCSQQSMDSTPTTTDGSGGTSLSQEQQQPQQADEDSGHNNPTAGEYVETERERAIRLEWERQMEAKKQKQAKNLQKKKLARTFR